MPSLSDYIWAALKKGFTKEELSERLIEKGYSRREIELAFFNIEKNKKENEQKGADYWEKVKILFSDPKGFFDKVREEGMGKSIILYSIIAGIQILLFGFFSLIMVLISRSGGYYPIMSFAGLGIYQLVITIMGFAFTFIYSGISYGIIKIFKGKGNYIDTYNACVYSLVPSIILMLLPLIGFVSFIYSIVLMTFGYAKYHEISYGKAVTAALIPIALVVAIFIGFVILLFFNMGGF